MKRILVFFVALSSILSLEAQLGNGSPAPNFSVTDLNGNSWDLYGEMSGGKSACLDFSATWCSPCWAFHQSHVLNQVNTNLASYTTVLFLEADFATNTNCLYNLSPCTKGTQGNWVAGTNYPMTDLSASNGGGVNAQYNINFVPTLYVISPDFRVWNIVSRTYQEYYDWIVTSFSLAATESISHSTCGDNGSVIMNVTGGLGSKKYKWSNGATTKDLTGIPGGTYNVTITDAQGYFKSFGPFTVDGPQRRVAITSSQKLDNKCFGDSKGSVKLTVAFGTAPYSYQWSNGETGSQINNLSSGNYTVTVLDAANCSTVASYNITQPALLTADLTGINESCDNTDGFVSILAKGGVLPYTYWLGNLKSNVGSFGKLKGGTYAIKVVDLNNCEVIEQITLSATHKPKLKIDAPYAITCEKDTIQLLGQDSDNGTEFVSEWYSRNGKILGDKYNLNIKTAKPGTYELKITNTINSCFILDSVIIKEDKKFPDIKVLGGSNLNCYLPETELSGETTDPRTQLYWTKLNSNFKVNKAKILIGDGGSYVFNVKDTLNQCIAKDTIEILSDKIEPQISIEIPAELNCKILSTLIHAENSDQNSGIEISWFTSDGNIVSGQNTLSPEVNKPGTYVLKLKNTINGCESNQAVSLGQNIELAQVKLNDQIQDISCIRKELELLSGLSSDYTILWSTKNGTIKGSPASAAVVIEKEGDYNLFYVNNISLCDKSIDFAIREQKPLNPEFSISQNELEVSLSDLTPGIIAIRSWDFGDGTKITSEINPVHKYLSTGEYQICLDVENECGIKKSCKNVSVALSGVLNLASWDIHPVACNGGKDGYVKLNVQGGKQPYIYEWNNGEKGSEILNLNAGIYSVIITDALGTKIEKSFTVKEPSELRQDAADIRNENLGFKNGSIKIKVGGGTPGYKYLWSNGETTEEISGLPAGTYSLKVTDANDCEKSFGPYEVQAVTASQDLQNKISILLEPNPINNIGRIYISLPELSSQSLLQLVDVYGRIILQRNLNQTNNIIEVDLSSKINGPYWIHVKSGKKEMSRIWVKN